MTRPLGSLTKAEKAALRIPFWSRVWQGDQDAIQMVSLVLFLGILLYVIFPYLYDYLLGQIVEDLMPRLQQGR